jgi:dTDP-4-amino-4,6-dideoxygalactose transaminase
LRVKLRHLEQWTEARRAHARRYNELLESSDVQIPEEMLYARHVYHVYAVRSSQRAALQRALSAQGIQTNIHYPIPVHLLPAHADLGHRRGDFPHAEAAADQVLSLPMFAELTDEQIQMVAAAVREAEGLQS